MRRRVLSGIRLSKCDYLRKHFESCVGDQKQTYRFLYLIKGVRKTSENISRVIEKSGDGIVNKTNTATAFNYHLVKIGETLVSRLPEVDELLKRRSVPDFCIWLYATNEDEVSKITIFLRKSIHQVQAL